MRIFPITLSVLLTLFLSACVHKQPGIFGKQPATTDTAILFRQLFLIKKNGKWGYMDSKGQIAIEPQFEDGREFSEGLAAVGFGPYEHTKWGYINAAGQMVIESAFEEAHNFSEGLALIRLNGSYGYINLEGRIIIEPQFGFSQPFSGGFALITLSARRLGPITFRSASKYFIDKQGNKLGNIEFDDGRSFSEGLASFSINGRSGCIDATGQVVIPAQFEWIEDFSEGLAPVSVRDDNGERWGYIDKSGQIAIQPQYEEAHRFSEGLAAIRKNGKFSYIDKSGKEIIKTEFQVVGEFSEGMANVMDSSGNHGFINKEGKIIVEPQYFPLVDDFSNGLAMVQVANRGAPSYYNPKYAYIDKTGKFIWPPTN